MEDGWSWTAEDRAAEAAERASRAAAAEAKRGNDECRLAVLLSDGTLCWRDEPGTNVRSRWEVTTCWQTGHRNRRLGPYPMCQVVATVDGRRWVGRMRKGAPVVALRAATEKRTRRAG